jgi:hypothetical protein
MESVTPVRVHVNELTSSQVFELVSTLGILAVLLPFLLYLHFDYLAFISLGPGGTPTSLAGYLRVKLLSLFALSNPEEPGPVPKRFQGSTGYLQDLPKRHLPRPCTRGIAPHRQVTQKASKAEYEKLAAAINAMGVGSDCLCIRTSCFEKVRPHCPLYRPDFWLNCRVAHNGPFRPQSS